MTARLFCERLNAIDLSVPDPGVDAYLASLQQIEDIDGASDSDNDDDNDDITIPVIFGEPGKNPIVAEQMRVGQIIVVHFEGSQSGWYRGRVESLPEYGMARVRFFDEAGYRQVRVGKMFPDLSNNDDDNDAGGADNHESKRSRKDRPASKVESGTPAKKLAIARRSIASGDDNMVTTVSDSVAMVSSLTPPPARSPHAPLHDLISAAAFPPGLENNSRAPPPARSPHAPLHDLISAAAFPPGLENNSRAQSQSLNTTAPSEPPSSECATAVSVPTLNIRARLSAAEVK